MKYFKVLYLIIRIAVVVTIGVVCITKREQLDQWSIQEINEQLGVCFSKNIEILGADDFGGEERDIHMKYYVWIIFSPEKVKLPNMKRFSQEYVIDDSEKKALYNLMKHKKRKIGQVDSFYHARWKNNEYLYTGEIYRTKLGDFIQISRAKEF